MATAGATIQSIIDGTIGMPPAQAAFVHTVKQDVKLAQTFAACGFAIILWDCLAYLHQEYRLVWTAKWSGLKASYLFTRYITLLTGVMFFVGFFSNFGDSSCHHYVKVMPVIGTLPSLGATFILLSRNYALWDNNTAMLALTLFLTAIQWAAMLAVAVIKTTSFPFSTSIKACIPTSNGGSLYILYWIFPAVVHLFLTVFMMVRGWELVAINDPSASLSNRAWQVMGNRYGQIFPVLVLLVELIQIVFYASVDDTLRAILAPLSGFVITVLVCQMVLTMRLTTKRGLHPFALSSQPQLSAGFNSLPNSGMGKMSAGGIQAFVNSHQAIDVNSDAGDMVSRDSYGVPDRRNFARTSVILPITAKSEQMLSEKEKERSIDAETIGFAEEESTAHGSQTNNAW